MRGGGEETVHKDPTRPVMKKEKTVELDSHFTHTKERGWHHVLFGRLGSHAAVFPAKFRTRRSWREWNGREGRMGALCSCCGLAKTRFYPPPPPPNPQLNLQTHDRNQPICIGELSVSIELKCLLTNSFKFFL